MFTIGETLKSDVEAARRALLPPPRPETDVTQLLSHGGVVVVVGGKPSNFTDALLRNPRIVFWHSTDPKAFGKDLPANTRAVVFVGAFMSHSVEGRIRKQAHARNVYIHPGQITTNDVKDLLTKMATLPVRIVVDPKPLPVAPPMVVAPVIVPVAPVQREPDVIMPTLRRLMKGELKNYVLQHADPAQHSLVEAKRLFPLLTAKGIQTTLASVEQATRFYVTLPAKRSRQEDRGSKKALREAQELAAETQRDHAAGPVRTVDIAPKSGAPNALLKQIDAALQMADDVRTQADLLTESLNSIKADVQRWRQTQQTLREFLD